MDLSPDTQQVLDAISALQRAMPEKDQGYWARLGAKHITLIATHGIEHFKRTINFEYAQWAVGLAAPSPPVSACSGNWPTHVIASAVSSWRNRGLEIHPARWQQALSRRHPATPVFVEKAIRLRRDATLT